LAAIEIGIPVRYELVRAWSDTVPPPAAKVERMSLDDEASDRVDIAEH
jgi:hypothetical protein